MAEATKAAAEKTGITKMEAVRQAIGNLGRNAKPTELQQAIKKTFGMELKLDLISTYKGEILRGGKKAKATAPKQTAAPKPPTPKPATPKATALKPAAPKAVAANGHAALSLEDVDTVKTLLGRLSPHSLKGLIDVLAR